MQHRRPLVAVASRSAPSSTQAAQVAHLRRAHRLAAWGLALLLGACTGDISPQRVTVADGGHPGDGGPTATGATQAQTVGPEGGTLALDGAQLTIPAGALSAPVTIRISRTLEAVPSSFTARSPLYRFEPEGLVFQLPVEVVLPFTGEVTAPVVYWSLLGVSGYERLPTRVEGGTAIAQVVHFSAGFVVDGDPLPPVPTFAGSTITFSWPNPAGMAPLLHMTWPSAVDVTSTAATMAYDICQSSVADGCDSFFATYATDAPDPAAPCRVVVSAAGAVTNQCELWNLPTGSKQYFAIRARDTAGTPSQSILRGWTRGDNEPPVLFGSPTFGCQGTSRIDLTFPGATDLVTMPADLVYEVCTSTLEGGCSAFEASSDNAIYSTAHAGQPCVNTWTTPGQMLECHFDNLSLRTKNYFTIRAKDEAGNPSTVPWTGSFVCDDAPPHLGASALDFTWTTPRTLQVSWNSAWDTRTTFEKMAHDICESTDPSGCNSFRAVYRSDDPRPSAPCKQVLRTQPSGNTVWNGECDFSSLDPRVTHYFAVRARDEAGNPSPEILTGSTLGDGTPPVMYVGSPPTFNCSGTPTIDMSWAGGSDPNYSGAAWTGVAYDICESDTPEGCNTFAPTYSTDDPDPAAPCKVTLAANGYTVTNACQFTNLSLSQKHYFAIRARDLAGNPSVDVLRSSFVCDETPPSQATWGVEFFEWRSPTELKMGFKSGSDQRTPATRLAYDVCVSPLYDGCAGAAFYPMYRTDDPSPTRACRVVAAAPPFDDLASNECRFGNLDPDVFIWVYVWVRARDEAGNPSAIVPMPPERGYNWRPFAPDTPTFSDVTPHTATVRWAPRPDDPQGDRYFDYTYFELCQSTEPNGCTPFTATYQMRGPAKAISGLTIGTTYYFSVRTMNSDQTYSAPSPVAALEAVDVSPPTTPTNLRNTFAGAAYIRVEWDESTDAGSLQSALQYQICQSTSSTGCDPFVPTTSPGWDGWFAYSRQDGFWRGWQVGPFPSSTAFYFSVRAKDETGNLSAASPPVRLMNRDTTVPRRPVAPTFSAVTSTSMVASWPPTDDNVTAANQLVYQLTVDTATAGCPALHTEYLTNPGVTSQPVTGLAVGCAYSFFLSARDEAGNWSLRGPSASQATVDTTPPAAPTGLRTVLLNAGSTLLAWDAPLDNFSPSAALRYEVCVGEGAAGCTPFHHSGDTGAGVFLYTASPLTSSTVYSFAVKAIDQAQNVSDASAVFTWRTSDITPPTPPGAPTFSDLSSISMTVSWSAASDLVSAASALVYEVTQDGASSGCASVHRSYTTLPGVTSWVVPDLTVGCTYSFRVRAKDEAGNRSDPGPAATSPPVPDTLAPSVPGLVTILSTSYHAITLGWTASSDNATAQASLLYEVCQTTDSGGCAPFHASATTAAGGLTYTASSLTPSTTYYFAVRAKDGSGNVSAPTALLSQATAALPRPTFAGLSAVSSVTGSSATLTWAPATDQNTLLENLIYRVCQSTTAGTCAQSFAASATTAPGATSYVVSGLQSGLPVYFVVRARNELGLDDANTVERSVTPVALASYAYVVNSGKSSIMRYGVNRRSGALTGPRTMAMVAQPAAFAVEPLGRRGFVTIGSASSLGLCTLDPVTGEATQAGGAATGSTPGAVAVAPSGRFVYTANGGDNTLSLFSVDAGTGALAAAGSATVGNGPRALALHPLGRALYVVNGSDATVSSHSVDAATGSLSPLGVIPTGAGPTSVVVDPQGRFVYVANGGATTISAYAIDPATGTLSAGVEQAAGATPGALAVNPSGRFLYAVHPSAATVSAFAIEAATGALTAVAAVSTGPGPAGVSVEPSGHFAYVANQTGGTVSIYSIDGTTGALTPTRKVTTGGGPTSVVFAQASYDPAGPTEPGEPRFSAVTETGLTISWDASSDAASPSNQLVYEVCQATTPVACDNFAATYTTAAGVTFYSVTGLTRATTYYFRVRAKNPAGHVSLPTAPGRRQTVGLLFVGSGDVAWEAAAKVDPWSLTFPIPAAAAEGDLLVLFLVTSADVLPVAGWEHDDTLGLYYRRATGNDPEFVLPLPAYGYNAGLGFVTAFRGVIEDGSPFGEVHSTASVAGDYSLTVPSVSTTGNQEMVLARCSYLGDRSAGVWAAPTGPAAAPLVAEARLYDPTWRWSSTTGIGVWAGVQATPGATGDEVCNVVSPRPWTNGFGSEQDFKGMLFTIVPALADQVPPTAPSNLQAVPVTPGSITLSWTAGTDDDTPQAQLYYELCQSTSPTGCAPFVKTARSSAGATSYTATGLLPNTTYYYTVRTRDASRSYSEPVGPVPATTPNAAAPTAPGALSFTSVSGNSLTVGWTASTSTLDAQSALVYEVCQALVPAGCEAFTATYTTPPGAITLNVTGLASMTTYYFSVRAKDSIGQTSTSSSGSATTTAAIIVSTVAGTGSSGFTDGPGGANGTARFDGAAGVAADAQGNVYVADKWNHRIRKIDSSGYVTTLAGSSSGFRDGPGATAKFSRPSALAIDGQGTLYVGDQYNFRIRKVAPDGTVTTFAGSGSYGYLNGSSAVSMFSDGLNGLAVDAQGTVYVSDGHCVRRVDALGNVTTIAGAALSFGSPSCATSAFLDGPVAVARFDSPQGLALDAQGNLFVADESNARVRKIGIDGIVSTVLGDGTRASVDGPVQSARVMGPAGLAFDAQGNLFINDYSGHRVRELDTSGNVTTVAGTGQFGSVDGPGGPAGTAAFKSPLGLTINAAGHLFVADWDGHSIRKIVIGQ